MPSTWAVALSMDAPEAVRLEHLHGLAATWLDAIDGVDHVGHEKPWAISPLGRNGSSTSILEFRFLQDGPDGNPLITPLVEELLARVDKATTEGLRLGSQFARVVPIEGVSCTPIASTRWSDMAKAVRPNRRWEFDLVSPTIFNERKVRHPLPTPSAVFGGLARRWDRWSPLSLPELDLRSIGLVVDLIDGSSVNLSYRASRAVGFVGRVAYKAYGASAQDRCALDAMASLAPYSGIGAGTTHGLGCAELVHESSDARNGSHQL